MKPPRTGRWARWGWLATTFAMGVALLITSWSSYRSAQEAVSTLNRGQADVLFEAAQQALRGVAAGDEAAALDSLLANQESAGLRYAGLFDSGHPIAEAGSTIEPIVAPTGMGRGGPPPVAVTVGSRLRITSFVPRPRAPFAEREETRGTPPPDSVAAATGRGSAENRSGGRSGRGAFPQRQAAALILEFEPVVANQLTAQSAQTFGLAALGTVVLLAAALLFWRLSMVHEREQIRFEQQRRLGALGEMSAVLAHEIRNPLASLKGHAQLLAGRLAPASAERHKADRVVGEAKRLENLVTDLLAFTRSAPIARRSVDPARLLRSAVDEVGGDTFTIEDAGAPSEWSLDPDRIRQALTNLLRNAAQASPEGMTIETSVAAANGKLVFTVRDHGDGLRSGDEGRVFEPFYTTRTQGTGLGLAVASRIADMHDGSITAANHPDGGAIFRIEIPRS
ncbi:MAG TPA: ATP-binding protein [Longimicrobiales bacterium]|nr:ATP-binding protein [Longimicrobiales bacterium]